MTRACHHEAADAPKKGSAHRGVVSFGARSKADELTELACLVLGSRAGMSKELTGRVALVTGVGRRAGIGAAIARELAGAGANVLVSFFREFDEAQAWGADAEMPESLLAELRPHVNAHACEMDLADPSSAEALIARAVSLFGTVDILINNAAHWEAGGIDRVDASQLDRHYRVNVRASVLLAAEFLRGRRPEIPGRIINITSGQGGGPMPGELAYAVTKATLDAMTVSLGAELAGSGVTVNAIDPGPTDTGWMSEAVKSELRRRSPAGLLAVPADTARVVRFLASDLASNVTGSVLRVSPMPNH